MRARVGTCCLIIVCCWGVAAIGCVAGPPPLTPEQIQAREEAARIAEEARLERERLQREATERKRNEIHALEQAGDSARGQGMADQAFQQFLKAFARDPDQPEVKERLRGKLIQMAGTGEVKPDLPEQARRHMVRGKAKIKTAGFVGAAEEMTSAIRIAPWWPEAYYNLGLMQERAGEYGKAMDSYELYLSSGPPEAEAQALQAKIYELEVVEEERDAIQEFAGQYADGNYVKIDGNELDAKMGPHTIAASLTGRSLEGTVTIDRYNHTYPWQAKICKIPRETVPITEGSIDPEAGTLQVVFMKPEYTVRWGETWKDLWCESVTLKAKSPFTVTFRTK